MSAAPTVTRLVEPGLDRVQVVFGAEAGAEAHRASRLAERGAGLYSPAADAGAVGVLMTNDRPTVEVVLGALATGARLVSLPLPGRGVDLAEYAGFLRSLCERHALAEVVVADDLAAALEAIGVPARAHAALAARPLAAPAAGGFDLVQFTSGSTRQPRPVTLTDEQLGANVAAVLEVVAPRPGDALVSWLPLAHDMGLVGMLLTGLAAGGPDWTGGGDIVLLDPRAFLRRPAIWVEALTRWRGAFTAAPDFAFRMAAERRPDGPVDLSPLRCAIVGGEIVRAGTLAAFAGAFGAGGMDPVALCPAYGMAELGVAATLTPPDVPWRELAVDPAGLAGNRVRRAAGPSATTLVASGRPLPGYAVTTQEPGAGGAPPAPTAPADRLGAGGGEVAVGRLAVRGPSLGADGATGEGFAGDDGWFRTGDAGVVDGGWLYVCGRVDDWLVAHGRNLYAPVVEAAAGDVDGVRAGRVTAVGLPTGGWVVVAEPAGRSPLDAGGAARLRQAVRRAAVDAAGARPDDVVIVAPGSLPLTSSGKLQRNEARARLLRGELVDAATSAAKA